MKRNTVIVLSFLALMILCLSGTYAAQDSKIVIGLSIPSQDTGFFKAVVQGAQTAADTAKAELKVVTSDYDSAAEVTAVQSLIDDAVSAILIYPLDYASDNLVSSLEAANMAKIPVFILGKDINQADADLEIASVLTPSDETMAGLVGQYFCDSPDTSKSVVVLEGVADGGIITEPSSDPAVTPEPLELNPQVISLKSMVDGLSNYMEEKCASVKLLVEDSTTYDNTDSIAYFDSLVSDGNAIGSVFVTNATLTNSLQDEVLLNGLHDLNILTSALSGETIGALETQSIAGIAAPEPIDLGTQGVQKALDLLAGKSVDARTNIQLVLIDSRNAVQYRGDCPVKPCS